MNDHLKTALENYIAAKHNLETVRDTVYPEGSKVSTVFGNDGVVKLGSLYPDSIIVNNMHMHVKDVKC